jgi:hypothetical protein
MLLAEGRVQMNPRPDTLDIVCRYAILPGVDAYVHGVACMYMSTLCGVMQATDSLSIKSVYFSVSSHRL